MSQDNQGNNAETLPQDGGAASGEGGTDAGSESTLSLDELNQSLGRDFKDKDTAVKSLKDTFDFVGKAGSYQESVKTLSNKLGTDEKGVLDYLQKQAESQTSGDPTPKTKEKENINPEDYISKSQYERDMFFKDNPDYAEFESVIDAMAATKGIKHSEVVALDDFKAVYDNAVAGKEAASKKSVVESSPQLGAATDKISQSRNKLNEAQQARQSGDIGSANQNEQEARKGAVGAVMDAYDIKNE